MFGKKLGLGSLADAAGALTETAKKAAEGAAGTLEVKDKLRAQYGDKISSKDLLHALELAGSIPFIGTPFKVVSTVLDFAITLPGQTSRTISDAHLKQGEPLIIIPVENFAIVLSANSENEIECNFYKNDPAVTNLDSLKTILGENISRKHMQNDSLGIDRDMFINLDALNIVIENIAAKSAGAMQDKTEKFILSKVFAFAIEQALGQVEGYEYLEYVPGFSFAMGFAIDAIADELAEQVVDSPSYKLMRQANMPANDRF